MTSAILHLHMAGFILALLVVVNVFVPARYGWKADMAKLSLLNRQIFQVHSIFIILLLALLSVLLLGYAPNLLKPDPLSRAILAGLTIFWSLRLYMQFFFYSPRIWRGKRFETVMHAVFSATWLYLVGVFAISLWRNLAA